MNEIFKSRKNYLVCVDSDGCAMDTMNIKHVRCFGPCMVAEWNLQKWEDAILTRWNEINLYSMTRGINLFKGLAMALQEIDRKYTHIPEVNALAAWVETAPELSNPALEQKIRNGCEDIFLKALHWSQEVNRSINLLPESSKKPFANVREGLFKIHEQADVAVVSSANKEAVEEEWNCCGLLEYVDILCCQDMGSKAHCIAELKKYGYSKNHILMVGDAPGDCDAAQKNGAFFYPILVDHEAESWQELQEQGIEQFLNDSYAGYEKKKKQEFRSNLECK